MPAGTSPATGQRLQLQPAAKTLPSTYRPCFHTSGITPPGNTFQRGGGPPSDSTEQFENCSKQHTEHEQK